MDNKEPWLKWAVELQAIAQAGLFYGKDCFDKERYERIRDISAEMLSCKTGLSMEIVKDLFCSDIGYQTPKIDTRAAIFQDGKILLVHESNGSWALPGGWCDVDLSVAENTVKEVKEEAGLDVMVKRVIAVQDREKHNLPIYAYKVCKIFLECEAIGGEFSPNTETTGYSYLVLTSFRSWLPKKTPGSKLRCVFMLYRLKPGKLCSTDRQRTGGMQRVRRKETGF